MSLIHGNRGYVEDASLQPSLEIFDIDTVEGRRHLRIRGG